MTWYYTTTEDSIAVYDHTGGLVVEDRDFQGTWSGTPDVVYDIMADKARQAASERDLAYAAAVFADGLADDIQEGTP